MKNILPDVSYLTESESIGRQAGDVMYIHYWGEAARKTNQDSAKALVVTVGDDH